MTWTIRPAVSQDVSWIADANARMALDTEHLELDVARLRLGVAALIADPAKGFYLLAEAGGEPVGQVMITYEWSDWRNATFWWIQSVWVDPAWRGRGVFKSLYGAVEDKAAETGGVCGLRLYVEEENERAREVYTRLGMAEAPYRMMQIDRVIPPRRQPR